MREEKQVINELGHVERIRKLEKELGEYIKVEEVIVAAGLLSKTKFEQAHDLVRNFP